MHSQAMETILYTMDDCVFCVMLKMRLAHERIAYREINDQGQARELGFETLPRLVMDGQTMDFDQAVAYLNRRARRAG